MINNIKIIRKNVKSKKLQDGLYLRRTDITIVRGEF